MGKISPPQDPLRRRLDQRRRELRRVVKWLSLRGYALRPTHLHPSERIFHQIEQHAKRPLIEPTRRLYASHVIDHERYATAAEQFSVRFDIVGVEVQDQVPAERFYHGERALERARIGGAPQGPHEIEAPPAPSARVQCLELGLGDIIPDHRHATPRPAWFEFPGPGDRI